VKVATVLGFSKAKLFQKLQGMTRTECPRKKYSGSHLQASQYFLYAAIMGRRETIH
jgi:hypothetical protein